MTDTTNIQEVETLFKLGAHFGHKKNRLHPKARKYVYSIIDGVSVIDLSKTVVLLENARRLLAQAGADNKVILIVGTKKIISAQVAELGKEHSISTVTTKWMAGLLTNFPMIIKNVHKLRKMKEERDNGTWEKYVKHERMALSKEMVKLEKLYGGIIELNKKPDILLVIDIKKEKNAVTEARANNIPIIAIADTNASPDDVDFPVLVNDDAATVVEYVLGDLVSTFKKAQPKVEKVVKSEVKTEPKVEPKVEAKPENKAEAKKEVKAEAKKAPKAPKVEKEVKAKPKAKTKK